MSFKIIGKTKDLRTGTIVLYAQASIEAYLNLIGDDFDEFEIQRRRVHHKAYERMKIDIKNGTLLPPITLAIKKNLVANYVEIANDLSTLQTKLAASGQVNILDGLQRTHILSDIKKDGHQFNSEQTVILEFWLEANVNNLIYRIIVLNSGQKPMSMKHQIELLFSATKENLKENIPDIEVFTERDEARRTKAAKFSLERLAVSYHAFITKSTEIDKENLIAQKLVEDKILEEGEEALGEKFNNFIGYLKKFCDLDREIFKVYQAAASTWFGSENLMISFFAAISSFSTDKAKEERVHAALDKLLTYLTEQKEGTDPLGYADYQTVSQGLPSRKTNVGYATRKHLFNVFKEYFREAGDKKLSELWATEAN